MSPIEAVAKFAAFLALGEEMTIGEGHDVKELTEKVVQFCEKEQLPLPVVH